MEENTITDTPWLHCLCQIKAQRVTFSHLTFPSLPAPIFPLHSSLFSPKSHFLSSHLPLPFIVFSRLNSPAPPPPLLDSPLRMEDLLADPDPTHKRKVDNQLPLSSGLNWSSPEFPHDAMPSESGLLPIIPHLLSHSCLIFGILIAILSGFCKSTFPDKASARWTFFSDKVTVLSLCKWPNTDLVKQCKEHTALYIDHGWSISNRFRFYSRGGHICSFDVTGCWYMSNKTKACVPIRHYNLISNFWVSRDPWASSHNCPSKTWCNFLQQNARLVIYRHRGANSFPEKWKPFLVNYGHTD